MLINEVCQKCRLTKKAVEYYVAQKLVRPEISENGYRDFSADDVARLEKIAVLRRLDLSVQNIKDVLDGGGQAALYKASEKKRMDVEAEKAKQAFLLQLAEKQDWDDINSKLTVLEKKQTILQRLSNTFPGYYGKYISLHFARYLNEPVVSKEQQEAFEIVVDFLDNVNFELPPDLRQYLDEITKNFDEAFVGNMFASLDAVISDPEKYMAENKEILEQYLLLKRSDDFTGSPAYTLQEHLRKLYSENGYDTIFIPAMRKLSHSYCKYYDALEMANEAFLKKYPHAAYPDHHTPQDILSK